MASSLTQGQVENLLEAMVLISSVAHEMDSSAVDCDTCGSKRRANWLQYQVKVKLDGVHGKITSLLNAEWYQRHEEGE